jgi:hypothetical protein
MTSTSQPRQPRGLDLTDLGLKAVTSISVPLTSRPHGLDLDFSDLALDLDLGDLPLDLNLNDLSLELKTATTMALGRKAAS